MSNVRRAKLTLILPTTKENTLCTTKRTIALIALMVNLRKREIVFVNLVQLVKNRKILYVSIVVLDNLVLRKPMVTRSRVKNVKKDITKIYLENHTVCHVYLEHMVGLMV